MTVSIGNGVSTGNIVTAETNSLTGRCEKITIGSRDALADLGMDQVKSRFAGAVACDWSAELGALTLASANANEAIALDTAVLCNGKPTVKCTFSDGVSTTYIGRYTPTNPISFANFTSIEIPIRISCNESSTNVANGANPFGIWLKAASGKQARLRFDSSGTYPGGWQLLKFTRSETGTVVFFNGASDWQWLDTETITAIDFVNAGPATGALTAPVWVGPIVVNARSRGVVSIRMDGEYESQYTMIKPLLDAAGLKASLAIVHQNIGTGSKMTAAQITEMVNAGSEAIHHTYSSSKVNGYGNATDWPTAVSITNDINLGWANMRANGWLSGIGKMVEGYTGGYFNSSATLARQRLHLAAFQAAGVDVLFTINSGSKTNNSTGRKYQEFTPGFVRSSLSITSATTPAQVITAIDQAEANGEWLILTMHEAVLDSATPAGNQMKVSDFATWISYLGTRCAVFGVQNMLLSRAFDSIYK